MARTATTHSEDEFLTASEPESDGHDDFNDATMYEDLGKKRHRLVDSLKSFIFILGAALVCFVAVCNSVTWHAQEFWGASGDFWQSQWIKFYDLFEGDDRWLAIWGTWIINQLVFWSWSFGMLTLDWIDVDWIRRYKIQADQKPVAHEVLLASVRVIFNQTVVAIPISYIFYDLMRWRGCQFGRELPTFHLVVFELVVFVIFEEIGFYYSHRLFHHPAIYKHTHKIHHEWIAPVGMVSVYAHPLEHVVANMMPVLLGPLICGSHLATMWLWTTIAIVSTIISHCGYHLPFFPSPEAHDYHHLKFNQCFGVMGVLDRFHGTDAQFRRTKQYERHFMTLCLDPVREMLPDSEKKAHPRGPSSSKTKATKA